jgi:DNA topoisomerase-1
MLADDSILAAKAAGLRYVDDRMPGIRRKRSGSSFGYYSTDGTRIRDEAELSRIRRLAVPPAYDQVWICPIPNGHVQATGRDARGRKQYRYHPRWREVRDATKYHRAVEFAAALPAIRKRVEADLAVPGLPREKVLAVIVRLLDSTAIRVGNEEYARENRSFGLTTLRSRHVSVRGASLRFTFRGKSGIRHAVALDDARIARIVRRCRDLPGEELFEYVDESGEAVPVRSEHVNAYIREVSGDDFTAKDFRTWLATIACAEQLAGRETASTQTERRAFANEALIAVAAKLGNTPAICRRCYVHPSVLNAIAEQGEIKLPHARRIRGLSALEARVLKFLSTADSLISTRY